MSISSTTARVQANGNGSVTNFAFPYPIFATADLLVTETDIVTGLEVVMQLGIDYLVTVSGSSPYYAGGTVVFVTAPPTGKVVTIIRSISIQQLQTYAQNAAFPTPTLEQSLDKLTLICQMLAENLARCIQLQVGDNITLNVQVPLMPIRAFKALAFDSSGNLIIQ